MPEAVVRKFPTDDPDPLHDAFSNAIDDLRDLRRAANLEGDPIKAQHYSTCLRAVQARFDEAAKAIRSAS